MGQARLGGGRTALGPADYGNRLKIFHSLASFKWFSPPKYRRSLALSSSPCFFDRPALNKDKTHLNTFAWWQLGKDNEVGPGIKPLHINKSFPPPPSTPLALRLASVLGNLRMISTSLTPQVYPERCQPEDAYISHPYSIGLTQGEITSTLFCNENQSGWQAFECSWHCLVTLFLPSKLFK